MILLVLASIFWAFFFLYPWIDWFMGNHGWLENHIRNYVYQWAEDNHECSMFAPIDFEKILKDLRR